MTTSRKAKNESKKKPLSRKRKAKVVAHSDPSQLQEVFSWAKNNPLKTALLLAGGAYMMSHKVSRKALLWGGSAILTSVVTPKKIMDRLTHLDSPDSTTVH